MNLQLRGLIAKRFSTKSSKSKHLKMNQHSRKQLNRPLKQVIMKGNEKKKKEEEFEEELDEDEVELDDDEFLDEDLDELDEDEEPVAEEQDW